MSKIISASDLTEKLNVLHKDIHKITKILFELANNDKTWWTQNTPHLVHQPLTSLQKHLSKINDNSLNQWHFNQKNTLTYSELDPLESITWLVSLCRFDKVLIGTLPHLFVDQIDLQWPIYATNWLTSIENRQEPQRA